MQVTDEMVRVARETFDNVSGSPLELATNDAWREALEAALAVDGMALQGWQDIRTAPKDASEIIYLNKFGEIGFCYWSEAGIPFDESMWYDEQADDECCPLYWLPRSHLPQPPAASDVEERR